MGAVAIPCYVTPTDVMMHFGHIVQDGYSLGAAFALIILGAGANVGIANWLRREYGGRAVSLFVALLIGSTLLIGLTADRTIADGHATVADHTHAFDSFTRLHQIGANQANASWVTNLVTQNMRADEKYGLGLRGLVSVVGVSLSLLSNRINIDRLFVPPSEPINDPATNRWNPTLSSNQITCVGVVGILVFAGFGLFLFYPPPDDILDDISHLRVELYSAVMDGDLEETRKWSSQWKLRIEKLPTSLLIRTGTVTESQRESVEEVLYGLKIVEEALIQGRVKQAQVLSDHLNDLYIRCRNEFQTAQ